MAKRDSFSQKHPLVCFLYFVAVILFATVLRHPAYILVSCLGAASYYGLLKGGRALRVMVLRLLPLFLLVSLINPLCNTRGEHILFSLFGRPFTLEALCYGMVTAGSFGGILLWFGCYNVVLTGDKFTALFGNLLPALSLLLVMVLRMMGELTGKLKQLLHARSGMGKGIAEQSTKKEKLRNGMTALSALTDVALEGSIVTGNSMKARGYGCGPRTNFNGRSVKIGEWGLLLWIFICGVLVPILGNLWAMYDPVILIAPVGWGLGVYALLLFLPTILQCKEAVLWHILQSRI
jgi:energy-coupling factor transport system permease protein